MTQSAQYHRQMRSIPHSSKDVFYVFVFVGEQREGGTEVGEQRGGDGEGD